MKETAQIATTPKDAPVADPCIGEDYRNGSGANA
jgi:hypothetical protein